jgi:hypothetical protein
VRYQEGGPAALAPALRAHRKGLLDEAVEGYRRAVEQDPGCLDAWVNLGSLLASVGSASGAREAFAAARAGGDPRAQRDVAFGFLQIGDLDEARATFEGSLAADPLLIGARLGLSRLCGELGDREAQLLHARRAVADAPGESSAYLELHRALFDDLDPEPSVEPAARAVALDPGYALARYLLAGALLCAGRPEQGREALASGLVEAGLVDALWYAAARPSRARCFATKRETLLYALSLAPASGPVIDLGVRHGVSTRLLAGASGGPVHGFDSFRGLPLAWQSRPAGAFSAAGELPRVPPCVRLHEGLFSETLPAFVRERPLAPRLIHVDSDLYESAFEALSLLGPLVQTGCVVVLDEYIGNASFRDDEHRALREVAARMGWSIDERALSWITGQGVVTVTAPGACRAWG